MSVVIEHRLVKTMQNVKHDSVKMAADFPLTLDYIAIYTRHQAYSSIMSMTLPTTVTNFP